MTYAEVEIESGLDLISHILINVYMNDIAIFVLKGGKNEKCSLLSLKHPLSGDIPVMSFLLQSHPILHHFDPLSQLRSIHSSTSFTKKKQISTSLGDLTPFRWESGEGSPCVLLGFSHFVLSALSQLQLHCFLLGSTWNFRYRSFFSGKVHLHWEGSGYCDLYYFGFLLVSSVLWLHLFVLDRFSPRVPSI